jgi:hypothetical protein
MSGKTRNPSKSCKACGAPVKANVRFCVACAIQRKAARVGIDPRKVHVGVVHPPCTTAGALGLPPLSTGGYLYDLLPIVKGGAK